MKKEPQKFIDDIYAESSGLFEDVSVLQDCADRYFEFAYSIKDDHIKKELSEIFLKDINEWRDIYNAIIKKEACSTAEYNSFFAMGKRLHQNMAVAMKKEHSDIKEQAGKYARKLSKGISYIQEIIDSMTIDLNSNDYENKKLKNACEENLVKLKQKIKAIENEFKIVEKSLNSKLNNSNFMEELSEELNQKSRELKTLSSQEMFEEVVAELQEILGKLKERINDFYKEMSIIISGNENVQKEIGKCKELKNVLQTSPLTVGTLLQNKKNLLKNYIERLGSSLIIKTKIEMIQNSNSFEQLYSSAINGLYRKLDKPIKKEEEAELFVTKKSQIENLHDGYIKEISPLYSLFCSGWSNKLVENLIDD